MKLRTILALMVFIGSYLPLSVILLAQNFKYSAIKSDFCNPVTTTSCAIPVESPIATIGFAIVSIICLGVTLIILNIKKPTHDINVTSFEYISTDLMNYTLPYVVSFMNVDFANVGNFVGFLVFLGWMYWITLRSGQILLNPVLIAFGWRLYAIEYTFAGSVSLQSASALTKVEMQVGAAKQTQVQAILLVSQ